MSNAVTIYGTVPLGFDDPWPHMHVDGAAQAKEYSVEARTMVPYLKRPPSAASLPIQHSR
jgi:hypothetical protein